MSTNDSAHAEQAVIDGLGQLVIHDPEMASVAIGAFESLRQSLADGDASDGYHTHNELYAYRRVYNAALFNEWWLNDLIPVVKSWRHSDGELAFGGGWFIVVATLPTGQISRHYEAEHWEQFQVPEVDLPPEYDGHTPAEALDRLVSYVGPDSYTRRQAVQP